MKNKSKWIYINTLGNTSFLWSLNHLAIHTTIFNMSDNVLLNPAFWSAICSIVLAQLFKPIVALFMGDGWNFKLTFSNGGMPSSHTAAVAAITISFGLNRGFESDIFILSLIFLLIVMNDAMNVRLETGKHSVLLNEWSELLSAMNKGFTIQNFKTMVGHTTHQVFWGMILGLCIGAIITLGFF